MERRYVSSSSTCCRTVQHSAGSTAPVGPYSCTWKHSVLPAYTLRDAAAPLGPPCATIAINEVSMLSKMPRCARISAKSPSISPGAPPRCAAALFVYAISILRGATPGARVGATRLGPETPSPPNSLGCRPIPERVPSASTPLCFNESTSFRKSSGSLMPKIVSSIPAPAVSISTLWITAGMNLSAQNRAWHWSVLFQMGCELPRAMVILTS